MRRFLVIWLGQLFSLIGSFMTSFVLGIWLWKQTGLATSLTLVGVSSGVAFLLTSTVAGSLVDRFNRKHIIVAADLLQGAITVGLLALAWQGRLESWHIYLAAFFSGGFRRFHYLALTASITLLVPARQLTRANSLLSLAGYASGITAPALAGLLMGPVGITGVMLIDLATCIFAVSTILTVRFPQVKAPEVEPAAGWRAATHGFRYILSRPSLRNLMLILFVFVLSESFGYPLIIPMVLARTGGNEVLLGVVQSTLGIGGVVGSLALTVWGGFKRRIVGVLLGLALTGVLGDMLMGLGRSLPVWMAAGFFVEVFIPLAFSSYDAIWQSGIPPEQQGRVFAARDMLSLVGEPVALLLTGLLADRVFEPAMLPGEELAGVFGWLVGTGPGAGMGLLLVICGLPCAVAALWGWFNRPVREIEAAG